MAEVDQNFGWIEDPAAVDAVVSGLPMPTWGDTPASAVDEASLPGEVLGWQAWAKASGTAWPELSQGSVGSCVSFGTSHALMLTQAGEIIAGDPEETRIPCMEAIYGGSRVEIGGGKISGDGSIGAWAAEWVRRWGVIAQGIYGSYDLTRYDQARCRDWGKKGVPTEIEDIAKRHPIGNCTLITSFSDAVSALGQGYGIQVASNRGFSLKRDPEGYAAPSGKWNHSMSFIGYRKTGKRPGLFIVNSWGFSSTTGPKSHPDAPASGWWVDAEVADGMLKQRDSFAFSRFTGFPARSINWLI
jgi:hypothetical protein